MIISILINVIFIPKYGEISASYSQLFAEIVVTCLAFYYSARTLKYVFPFKSFLINITAVLPFILIYLLFDFYIDNYFILLFVASFSFLIYYSIYQFLSLRIIF